MLFSFTFLNNALEAPTCVSVSFQVPIFLINAWNKKKLPFFSPTPVVYVVISFVVILALLCSRRVPYLYILEIINNTTQVVYTKRKCVVSLFPWKALRFVFVAADWRIAWLMDAGSNERRTLNMHYSRGEDDAVGDMQHLHGQSLFFFSSLPCYLWRWLKIEKIFKERKGSPVVSTFTVSSHILHPSFMRLRNTIRVRTGVLFINDCSIVATSQEEILPSCSTNFIVHKDEQFCLVYVPPTRNNLKNTFLFEFTWIILFVIMQVNAFPLRHSWMTCSIVRKGQDISIKSSYIILI